MGWRFRRSVQVIPGIRLNFSKSGVSTTVGWRGFRTTYGHGRVTRSVGIPGTGMSYVTTSRRDQPAESVSWHRIGTLIGVVALPIALVAYSAKAFALGNLMLLVAGVVFVPRIVRSPAVQDILHREEREQARQAEAQAKADLDALAMKIRVLLYFAREDGVVRAKERDLIVQYLRVQPGAGELNDTWLKEIHAKMPRDSFEGFESICAVMGQRQLVDTKFIETSEALVTLSKKVSPGSLRALTALRHQRNAVAPGAALED